MPECTSLKLVLFLFFIGKCYQDRYVNNGILRKICWDIYLSFKHFFFHRVKQLSPMIQNGLFNFSPFNCVLFLLPDLRYLSLCGGLQEQSEIKQVDSTPPQNAD